MSIISYSPAIAISLEGVDVLDLVETGVDVMSVGGLRCSTIIY